MTAAVALTKGFLKKKGISPSTSLVKQLVLQGTRTESGLTENIDGQTWSVRGPNPKLVSDTSETKGWFEGDTCK